jgi:hypothetical protein
MSFLAIGPLIFSNRLKNWTNYNFGLNNWWKITPQ